MKTKLPRMCFSTKPGAMMSSAYLDGDDKVSSVLQEVVSVQSDDPRLVGLRDISEDDVYHSCREQN